MITPIKLYYFSQFFKPFPKKYFHTIYMARTCVFALLSDKKTMYA